MGVHDFLEPCAMQIYFWHIYALKVLALFSEYVNIDPFRDFHY